MDGVPIKGIIENNIFAYLNLDIFTNTRLKIQVSIDNESGIFLTAVFKRVDEIVKQCPTF